MKTLILKKKNKNIYQVFCRTQYGIGMQPVKASTKKEAREKFKKRNKKSVITSVEKADSNYKPLISVI